jgi:hypothetical protein
MAPSGQGGDPWAFASALGNGCELNRPDVRDRRRRRGGQSLDSRISVPYVVGLNESADQPHLPAARAGATATNSRLTIEIEAAKRARAFEILLTTSLLCDPSGLPMESSITGTCRSPGPGRCQSRASRRSIQPLPRESEAGARCSRPTPPTCDWSSRLFRNDRSSERRETDKPR